MHHTDGADADEALSCRVSAAPALITYDQLWALLMELRSTMRAGTRQLALDVLTQPGGAFVRQVSEDPAQAVVARELLAALDGYRSTLQKVAGWLDEAELRLLAALAEHDIDRAPESRRANRSRS